MDERCSGSQRVPSDGSCGRGAFARSQDGACAQIGSYARVSAHSIRPRRGTRSRWYPAPSLSCQTDAYVSFQSVIINLPKTRSVVADAEDPDGDDKLVLLRVQREGAPSDGLLSVILIDTRPSALADLSADARSYLEAQNATLTTYNIELGYDYWTAGSLVARPREFLT